MNSEADQPNARQRVCRVLVVAGPAGVLSADLCRLANTNAASRRCWEMTEWYGLRIEKRHEGRNQYRWIFRGIRPWARPLTMPCAQAEAQEKARLADLTRVAEDRLRGQLGLSL